MVCLGKSEHDVVKCNSPRLWDGREGWARKMRRDDWQPQRGWSSAGSASTGSSPKHVPALLILKSIYVLAVGSPAVERRNALERKRLKTVAGKLNNFYLKTWL